MSRKTVGLDDYKLRPVATPELVLEKARGLHQLFNKPLNADLIEEALEQLRDTHQIATVTVSKDAEMLLKIEQGAAAVLFQNSRVKFVGDRFNEYWMTIKAQADRRSTLADYRDFIAKLIEQYGEKAMFGMTSDQGDEYFNLRVKE
jgi:hypothetical protein